MKTLTLSIVIPVYNDKNYLINCLESIAKQTVMPSEVIVVDNNSTDGVAKAVRKYPFVRLVTEKKRGVVFARDAGFNATRTDIIGRVDSDTILPITWVERVKEFYADEGHQEDALTGGCYFYNVRIPHIVGWWQGQIAFRYNRLLMSHYILFGSNMAFTRTQWVKVRSQVCHETDVHEDLDLAIHLHRLGFRITYKESLKVGVVMRRVRSRRGELWENIMWWPKTLRRHGKKTWVFGWLGAVVFYAASPIVPIAEWLARAVGRTPKPD